jgi:large subunit ribosomal protein L25
MGIACLKSERREPKGKKEAARLRRRGLIPAVIYGHKKAPESVAISLHELTLTLGHMAHVLKLEATGDEQFLIKEIQYDHLQKTPIHVDLLRVDPNERVHVKVSIELRGTPAGSHEGGTLVQVMTEIELDCLLTSIPDSLRPSVSELGVSEVLQVKDLELPAGAKAMHGPDDVVATVRAPRGGTDEEEAPVVEGEEAEGKEPERIGRTAKETEDKAGG